MSHTADAAQDHETRAVEEERMEKAVAQVRPGAGGAGGWARSKAEGRVFLAAVRGVYGAERVQLVFSFPHHAVARFRHLVPRPE